MHFIDTRIPPDLDIVTNYRYCHFVCRASTCLSGTVPVSTFTFTVGRPVVGFCSVLTMSLSRE